MYRAKSSNIRPKDRKQLGCGVGASAVVGRGEIRIWGLESAKKRMGDRKIYLFH